MSLVGRLYGVQSRPRGSNRSADTTKPISHSYNNKNFVWRDLQSHRTSHVTYRKILAEKIVKIRLKYPLLFGSSSGHEDDGSLDKVQRNFNFQQSPACMVAVLKTEPNSLWRNREHSGLPVVKTKCCLTIVLAFRKSVSNSLKPWDKMDPM